MDWRRVRDGLITLVTGNPPLRARADLPKTPEYDGITPQTVVAPRDIEITIHGPEIQPADVRQQQDEARIKLRVIDHKLAVIAAGGRVRRGHRDIRDR